MPVLCNDDILKTARQPIDERNDLVASVDRQRPARHEIGLQVDRQKNVLTIDRDCRGHRDQLLLSPQRPPPFALIVQNDDQREHQRQDQIEKPEHQQGGDDIGLRRVWHRLEKRELQHAEAPGRVADKRNRKRGDKDAKHDREAGIGGRREREIDDARRADQLQGPSEQLPRRDRRTRVDKLEGADPERRKMKEGADDVEARRPDKRPATAWPSQSGAPAKRLANSG